MSDDTGPADAAAEDRINWAMRILTGGAKKEDSVILTKLLRLAVTIAETPTGIGEYARDTLNMIGGVK